MAPPWVGSPLVTTTRRRAARPASTFGRAAFAGATGSATNIHTRAHRCPYPTFTHCADPEYAGPPHAFYGGVGAQPYGMSPQQQHALLAHQQQMMMAASGGGAYGGGGGGPYGVSAGPIPFGAPPGGVAFASGYGEPRTGRSCGRRTQRHFLRLRRSVSVLPFSSKRDWASATHSPRAPVQVALRRTARPSLDRAHRSRRGRLHRACGRAMDCGGQLQAPRVHGRRVVPRSMRIPPRLASPPSTQGPAGRQPLHLPHPERDDESVRVLRFDTQQSPRGRVVIVPRPAPQPHRTPPPTSPSRSDLYHMFAFFGNIISARIMVERETGRSRGFGCVFIGPPRSAMGKWGASPSPRDGRASRRLRAVWWRAGR